jgi:hypothetical protein
MLGLLYKNKNEQLIFWIGLVIFIGLNIFSASTFELHFDEAYYWIYAVNPASGYFDHPPMIAYLIQAGQHLFPNELGVRFLVIVMSSLTIILLWRIIKRYTQNALLFWLTIYSIVLIHPYAFIATPDAPLLFFSTLFLYFYSRYLDKNSFQNTVLIAFTVALMVYSKYHALLFLGLIVFSNLKLLKRISSWVIIILSTIYLLPHIFWLAENNFVTINYHLFDSHQTGYNLSTTINYLISLFLVTGPLAGWLFITFLFKFKPETDWERALKISGAGIIIFFFVATFLGDFEAHWILVAIPPLFIIGYKQLMLHSKWHKLILVSGILNFVLILLLRLTVPSAILEIKGLKLFSGNKTEAKIIKQHTGNLPVFFQDNWHKAALYAFYTQNKRVGNLSSGLYRKTQFDLLNQDEFYKGDKVIVLSTDSTQFTEYKKIATNKTIWYYSTIERFNTYYKTTFTYADLTIEENSIFLKATIYNPYEEPLQLGNNSLNTSFILYGREPRKWINISTFPVDSLSIPPLESREINVRFEIEKEIFKNKQVFLSLKIGELKPIPIKYLIENYE